MNIYRLLDELEDACEAVGRGGGYPTIQRKESARNEIERFFQDIQRQLEMYEAEEYNRQIGGFD